MFMARNHFSKRVYNRYQRLTEILLLQAGAVQQRPVGGPFNAVGQLPAPQVLIMKLFIVIHVEKLLSAFVKSFLYGEYNMKKLN